MDPTPFAQLCLRLALGVGFLLPVLDRFGVFGPVGNVGVAWGSWTVFVDYTHTLLPYLPRGLAEVAGVVATVGEIVCGVLLIVGWRTRLAAFGSAALTLTFALSMLVFADYRAPFTYAVFVVSFASLLLAGLPRYAFSLDARAQRR